MKISLLSSDMSHNCIARPYILAKMLQEKYDVEIVGPMFGNSIWKPVEDDKSIDFKPVKTSKNLSVLGIRHIYKKAQGDIIYACKPLFSSFGIGLLKKMFSKKILILDIDDWELGFRKEYIKRLNIKSRLRYLLIDSIFKIFWNKSFWNILILEKFIRFSDKVTVSNTFLQKRFGGNIIYHGRDEKFFNPDYYSSNSQRKNFNVNNNKKVIVFFGTPNPHKGIESLIDAIRLNNSSILLFLVGMTDRNYCRKIEQYAKDHIPGRTRFYGLQPFSKVPEFLSLADIVIIPQLKNYSSIGQVPAKVFDAMAMAKPIIATDVSDLPLILKKCGLIVKPSNPEDLNNAVDYLVSNPGIARTMGRDARKRFVNEFSYKKIGKELNRIIDSIKISHN